MKLHEHPALFRQAILSTAEKLNILPIYVEKDYWVTYVLYHLFHDENIKEFLIFKGGTALSKCYGVIERFSEDIDLVIIHDDSLSNNQLDKRIKQISQKVIDLPNLDEITIEGVTNKQGMIRKTVHTYPRGEGVSGAFGQVRDQIVIEATRLGHFEPYTEKPIISLIGQMILKQNQNEIAEQYDLLPFHVSVLEPKRTFCEKIMSLVRFSYDENPINALKQKIRHCYDLHKLLQLKEIQNFFNSPEFAELLQKVKEDDRLSFKHHAEWLDNPLSEALFIRELDTVWSELKLTYERDFRHLVYGVLPPEQDILTDLNHIKNRIQELNL